jgi:hypothetical protein
VQKLNLTVVVLAGSDLPSASNVLHNTCVGNSSMVSVTFLPAGGMSAFVFLSRVLTLATIVMISGLFWTMQT